MSKRKSVELVIDENCSNYLKISRFRHLPDEIIIDSKFFRFFICSSSNPSWRILKCYSPYSCEMLRVYIPNSWTLIPRSSLMRVFELFDFENFKMSFLNVSQPPSTRIFNIFPTCRVNGTANHAVLLTAMPKSTLRPCIGWHCSRLKLATTATSYT